MTTQTKPEIILYDLACIKNVCFSPVVWRIRLMLNYKRIPYKTIFLDFPDIEPTLKSLGIKSTLNASGTPNKYTVPAIHHLPTSTYLMDSLPIAHFLSTTYPLPALPLTSPLGQQIEVQARALLGKTFSSSLMPREILILSPRSQVYFRRTREAALGHPLEDLLDGKEEERWTQLEEGMSAVGKLMRENKAEGPFVLGAEPSYTDFFIAGSLQTARVIDEEGVFKRNVAVEGFKDVYEACQPWMERKD